jgi:hypothetical protein
MLHSTAIRLRLIIRICASILLLSGLIPPCSGSAQSLQDQEAMAYIQAHAEMEDMVMVPMRDSVRLYHLIIFPKDQPRANLPTVLIRIPYLINPERLTFARYIASFIEHGYAVVFQSVRGRYFSEGTYTYLVRSGEDGYDTVEWIARQPWSNGKVGAIGCSSSAEEQHKLNAFHAPGFAAAVPFGSGAGIGRIGPYNEMGNFYRGGAMILNWASWYYGAAYRTRPLFSSDLTREEMIRVHQFWNLDPEIKPDGTKLIDAYWTLPINQIMNVVEAMPSDMDDFVNRLPNDPRWKDVEFGTEDDRYSTPMLMINSWYDIGVAPNVAMFAHQVENGATEAARNESRMIISPVAHCAQLRETEHTVVGERDMGDARFDYITLVQKWYDHLLKGEDNDVTSWPRVQAYMMGANEWRAYDSWPPRGVQPVTYYLDSDGGANTRLGDGRLTTTKPSRQAEDLWVYDPMTPVPTNGGGTWCCYSNDEVGSWDQRGVEMRSDVLVYSTPPLTRPVEITGPVEVSLYLSSDRKDTDLTVKLIDVEPDGRAYNLDDAILRVRWREGWERPVFMEPGQVYRVDVGPLVTSNRFDVGHRIRIEVSSSNFPHYDRNLNTGGNNYDEKDPLVAHNVLHHGGPYPAAIVLPVLPTGGR